MKPEDCIKKHELTICDKAENTEFFRHKRDFFDPAMMFGMGGGRGMRGMGGMMSMFGGGFNMMGGGDGFNMMGGGRGRRDMYDDYEYEDDIQDIKEMNRPTTSGYY